MTMIFSYAPDLIAIIASLGAMFYCMVLSRRLAKLTSFDKGLGSAIAVMSSQVDEMKSALKEAKAGTEGAGQHLGDLVDQARKLSTELEMMIAACHDFAEEAIAVQDGAPEAGTDLPTVAREISDQNTADVTPMFGTQRPAQNSDQDTMAGQPPLFRHRRPIAG